MSKTENPEKLKAALDAVEDIIKRKGDRTFLFFFDFDGTLAPIGPEPDKVELHQNTSIQLEKLARNYPVAIVSGRDRKDIESKIGLSKLYYAGSHGFDISGPGEVSHLHPKADELMPEIERIAQEFKEILVGYEGVWVEHKKFAVAIHYREADQKTVEKVQQKIKDKMQDEPAMKWDKGKSIIEIKPDVEWHKGKAVNWIMEHLGLDEDKCLPIYLGDDTTDEDAFRILSDRGVGILVDGNEENTSADYILDSQQEVSAFIKKLLSHV